MNGNSLNHSDSPNGHMNGNGKGTGQRVDFVAVAAPEKPTAPPKQSPQKLGSPQYEHPLMLQQSSQWSRAILWILLAATTGGLIWANMAQIEEAVPAQGKLEPQGAVKEVQVPLNGVVRQVYVRDGQKVKKGDLLLGLDPTTNQAQLDSLTKVKTALNLENQFYQAQLDGVGSTSIPGGLAPEFVRLTDGRSALMSENKLLETLLNGGTAADPLTAQQSQQLQSNRTELETRSATVQLEGDQLRRQLNQAGVKLEAARRGLVVNQKILASVKPLSDTGAISQIQFLKQQQEVEAGQSDVSQLLEEQARLSLAISETQSKVQNAVASNHKDLTVQIAANNQKIAEINGQLTKAVVENNKKIAEIDSQLSQARQALQYGEVRSPVDGTVFEMKANTPGFVATSSEPVLKIVPEEALVAKVVITNQDIGFVKEGMSVDVRVDSFPFSEFGDVKGTLIWVGSDALPPTQIQPAYTFPAKVKLDQQSLRVNGREISLQSGMSLSANIKIRKRTVMSVFTDQFKKATESLNFVR